MLINVKTIVGILTFMSRINFVLRWVEHEKSFITSGPGQLFEIQKETGKNVGSAFVSHIVVGSSLILFFYRLLKITGRLLNFTSKPRKSLPRNSKP